MDTKTKSTLKSLPPLKRLLAAIGAAAFWLALWHIAAVIIGKEILVPTPLAVIRRLIELVQESSFWLYTGATLLRIIAGFGLALAVGCVLGTLMHLSRTVRILFDPLLTVVRATPVSSFIILALVWIKGAFMPVFIAFLMVLPIVCANLTEGLGAVDKGLLEMARVYEIRGLRLIGKIYAPSVSPYLLAACRTGMGLAWKAGVAAEVIGRTAHSIGNMLYESKLYLETADLFAWTAVVVLLSRIIEMLFVSGVGILSRKYGYAKEDDDNGDNAQ
ncbi:MAG: ABC transporter permease subunit [Ruminococcaceae bacterium]|nr:ABC transporter permease subunit [Oscillospiraceae bacterium]